jgi:hypothetical protein
MSVPNVFANATTSIPLVQLDQNFNTGITLGNTTVYLGNTTTSFGNVTLTGAVVNGTVGATTPATGAFTTISASSDGSISGRLGVGAAASATYPLNLSQNTDNFVRFVAGSSRVWRLGADGASAAAGTFSLVDDSAGATRFVVQASGNMTVGAGTPQGYQLESNSNSLSLAYFYRISDGTGVYLPLGNNSWSAASDERLKDIIEPITDASNKVATLRAVIGKYKTDEEGARRPFIIAQDVQKVLPEAVDDAPNKDEDGKPMLGVQYSNLIPLLVAAIKEQTEQIKTLTARLAALETKQ